MTPERLTYNHIAVSIDRGMRLPAIFSWDFEEAQRVHDKNDIITKLALNHGYVHRERVERRDILFNKITTATPAEEIFNELAWLVEGLIDIETLCTTSTFRTHRITISFDQEDYLVTRLKQYVSRHFTQPRWSHAQTSFAYRNDMACIQFQTSLTEVTTPLGLISTSPSFSNSLHDQYTNPELGTPWCAAITEHFQNQTIGQAQPPDEDNNITARQHLDRTLERLQESLATQIAAQTTGLPQSAFTTVPNDDRTLTAAYITRAIERLRGLRSNEDTPFTPIHIARARERLRQISLNPPIGTATEDAAPGQPVTLSPWTPMIVHDEHGRPAAMVVDPTATPPPPPVPQPTRHLTTLVRRIRLPKT